MTLSAAIAVNGTVDDSLGVATWIEVHEQMGKPTTYRLRYEIEIGSSDFDLLVDSRVDAGSALSILVPGRAGNECLVKGPVGAHRIHFEHGGSGSYVEVHGSDTAITMDREAKSTLWTDLTDSDAVTSILGAYGLVPDVDTTSAGHFEAKHTMVQRESDLSFVRRLARRNGFLFWITADAVGIETAHFKKVPVSDAPAVTLTINQSPPGIEQLDLRWDVERPTSVESVQVDLNTTNDLSGSTSDPPLAPLGTDDLSTITGDTRSILLSAPVDDAGDLQARANGALVDALFFIRANGETTIERTGQPIRAHSVIEIQGAGSRHSGKYFVAGVRHTIDAVTHRMELELLRNSWGS